MTHKTKSTKDDAKGASRARVHRFVRLRRLEQLSPYARNVLRAMASVWDLREQDDGYYLRRCVATRDGDIVTLRKVRNSTVRLLVQNEFLRYEEPGNLDNQRLKSWVSKYDFDD